MPGLVLCDRLGVLFVLVLAAEFLHDLPGHGDLFDHGVDGLADLLFRVGGGKEEAQAGGAGPGSGT